MLTGWAAVLVLLTRVRLGVHGGRAAGVADVSGALLTWHTTVGVVALVIWIVAMATSSPGAGHGRPAVLVDTSRS